MVTQDFTKYIDLEGLLDTKFEISDSENELDVKNVDMLKLLKIVLYQVAIFLMQSKQEIKTCKEDMDLIAPEIKKMVTSLDGRIDQMVFKIDNAVITQEKKSQQIDNDIT